MVSTLGLVALYVALLQYDIILVYKHYHYGV